MGKRIFLIVLDSAGIGEMPDAADYGDVGSNTLRTISKSPKFHVPNMKKLGYFNIDGVAVGSPEANPAGAYARLAEKSKGKDTTTGHWEIAGLISEKPMPIYPNGFPDEVIHAFEKATGRGVLCNRPYSGTDVIRDFGPQHIKTGDLIVYTSADSVFQVAAHEDVVPVTLLYEYCQRARDILQGKHGVGRVIARPFIGTQGNFTRTSNRHDFSLQPPGTTMLDQLNKSGLSVIGVGKINDIFAGKGITEFERTKDNEDGIGKTLQYLEKDFTGLCFVNLVDFDMLYGHRNDIDGYAGAMSYFDRRLPELIAGLNKEDILMITADHGCDPGTPSTDHSREYIPLLMYGSSVRPGKNYGTRRSFADIGATILDFFGISPEISGTSMLSER